MESTLKPNAEEALPLEAVLEEVNQATENTNGSNEIAVTNCEIVEKASSDVPSTEREVMVRSTDPAPLYEAAGSSQTVDLLVATTEANASGANDFTNNADTIEDPTLSQLTNSEQTMDPSVDVSYFSSSLY